MANPWESGSGGDGFGFGGLAPSEEPQHQHQQQAPLDDIALGVAFGDREFAFDQSTAAEVGSAGGSGFSFDDMESEVQDQDSSAGDSEQAQSSLGGSGFRSGFESSSAEGFASFGHIAHNTQVGCSSVWHRLSVCPS